ncbi:MAG: hypothetical protein M3Q40_02305 [Pseudomonadota bacterium]|nr:hypothetical protein [Pseudomonadota bacterium]
MLPIPTRPLLFRLLLIACACAASPAVLAQGPAAQWWGNLNIGSRHFGSDRRSTRPGGGFNEFNPGIGIEAQWQPRHGAAAGYFRNSVDEDSVYALYHYTPLRLGRFVRLGGMAGVVTGYPGYNDGGLGPAAGLIAKIEGRGLGINLIFLPAVGDVVPPTLGLQAKWAFRR